MGSKSYKMSIMLDMCKSIIKSKFSKEIQHIHILISKYQPIFINLLFYFFLICFNETDDKYIFTKYVLVSLKNENPWRPFVYPPVGLTGTLLGKKLPITSFFVSYDVLQPLGGQAI